MQARRAKGPAVLAMAAAGVLGGIAVSRRRRVASADEPLEPGALPQVGEACADLEGQREAGQVAAVGAPGTNGSSLAGA